MKWKNARPKDNAAYEPTDVEHLANIATHGLCLPLVWSWSRRMLGQATSDEERRAALTYGGAIMGLFVVSTVFHLISYFWRSSRLRHLFHRGDRAMIYLFIAGSYTPWLALKVYPVDSLSLSLERAVWVLASLGIVYQQVFHERFKWLETTFYVLLGVAPAYAVFEMEDTSGVVELRWGGAAYLAGVVFFKMDGVLPFAHAVWHLHVVAGALIHLHAVTFHLFGHNLFSDPEAAIVAEAAAAAS